MRWFFFAEDQSCVALWNVCMAKLIIFDCNKVSIFKDTQWVCTWKHLILSLVQYCRESTSISNWTNSFYTVIFLSNCTSRLFNSSFIPYGHKHQYTNQTAAKLAKQLPVNMNQLHELFSFRSHLRESPQRLLWNSREMKLIFQQVYHGAQNNIWQTSGHFSLVKIHLYEISNMLPLSVLWR